MSMLTKYKLFFFKNQKVNLRSLGIITTSLIIGCLSAVLVKNSELKNTAGDEAWEIPEERKFVLASDLDVMLGKPLFGGKPVVKKVAEKKKEATNKSEWKMIGITQEGSIRRIMILKSENNKAISLGIGDILPNGEKVITINKNNIITENKNERNTISLFIDNNDNKGK